jgi:hypothetical protein
LLSSAAIGTLATMLFLDWTAVKDESLTVFMMSMSVVVVLPLALAGLRMLRGTSASVSHAGVSEDERAGSRSRLLSALVVTGLVLTVLGSAALWKIEDLAAGRYDGGMAPAEKLLLLLWAFAFAVGVAGGLVVSKRPGTGGLLLLMPFVIGMVTVTFYVREWFGVFDGLTLYPAWGAASLPLALAALLALTGAYAPSSAVTSPESEAEG